MAEVGGPTTGQQDAGYPGSSSSSTGTVITDPYLFFVQATQLFNGDVIIMPSGLIWQITGGGSCTYGCYDPESAQGQYSKHWTLCQDANVFSFDSESAVNYLDEFINFVNKYCSDCNTNF